MKNSWNIFKMDIKNISSNLIAAVIIGGLIFLPSLYAWLNISASWDPYGQTDQIPVGIVNEDRGEVIRDEEVDVGKELVNNLRQNNSLDWQFMNRDKAMNDLEKGDLFAVIVIPSNFSEKLGTVIQSEPEKANVEYYVNEKINAIAPKITEKGASVIVDDISSNFISTVNGIIFNIFNEIGLELEEELPDIRKFENYIFEMEERLPEIHDTLAASQADAVEAQEIVGKVQSELPEAERIVGSGIETVDQTNHFLNEAESRLNKIGPKINQDLANAEKTVAQVNDIFSRIEAANLDLEDVQSELKTLEKEVDRSIESIESVENSLETILEQMKKAEDLNKTQIDQIESTLTSLDKIKTDLEKGRDNTDKIMTVIKENETEVQDLIAELSDQSKLVSKHLNEFINEYNSNIEPTVLKEIETVKSTLLNARRMLVDVQAVVPKIDNLLSRTNVSLHDGEDLLEEVLAEYPYVNDKVKELASRIRSLQAEADINEIIELLQNDPEAEEGFFSEPVMLSENKVFPIENYGSGMTPFYSVLSLWVGGLLLISLLSTNIQQPHQYNAREVYFGKLFTFILIGLLQTFIVTNGDIFLIKVNMANPVWFVVFGLFVSFVFITIIYSFVSIFGDVGKAMAIVMLVLQIAGSGGTYPVALLPKFFQTVSPFLPFTYAVNIMREAVGGIVWSVVLFDLMILSLFAIIAMVLGAFLKEPMNKRTEKLMGDSKDSGIFQ